MNSLQRFINYCLRKIMNIRWFDKVRSEDLWQRANQDPINTHIKKSSNGTHKAKEADDDLGNTWRRDTESEL
jgi:hypothetical protein